MIHSGIKGQKRGVRRYQNKDGTWTPEGKRRRAAREGYSSDSSNKNSKDDKSKAKNDLSNMTDDELRSHINRMQLEDQYRQYLAKTNPKKKSKATEIMAKLTENAVMTIGNKAIEAMANKIFQKSKPKKKPIDLDSLTPEKLKSMNKEELDEVNAYADAMNKAKKIVDKSEKIDLSMKERISDISNHSAYQKAGEAYFNSLASDSATSDEQAYYRWLGENASSSRHY